MSQAVFGKLAGIASSTISMYENGNREPSIDFLLWLERITGFTLNEMVNTEINILDLPDPIPNRTGKVTSIPERILLNPPEAKAEKEATLISDAPLRMELNRIYGLITEIETRLSQLEEKAKGK